MDCFVIPQGGTPHNDSPKAKGDWYNWLPQLQASSTVE